MAAVVCLFPLDPPLAVCGQTSNAPVALLAARLGVHTRTIHKWAEDGGVDVWQADRIATALGVNAEKMWPGWEETADHVAALVPEQLDFLDLAEAM